MTNNKVCSQCGKKIFNICPEPSCKAYWENYWENKVNENLSDYQSEIGLLKDFESNILTSEDYQKLKKIKSEVKKWENQVHLKSSSIKTEIKKLLTDIEIAEKKFPNRIKLQNKSKDRNCSHQNISWNEFFKPLKEKSQVPYCLDCGEEENNSFTKQFQRWYCKEIEKWIESKGLKMWEFTTKFLKKKDYYDNWCDLRIGIFFENIKDELPSFQEMSSYLEEYCLEFAKEKGVKVDNNSNPNKNQEPSNQERERERESKNILIIKKFQPSTPFTYSLIALF